MTRRLVIYEVWKIATHKKKKKKKNKTERHPELNSLPHGPSNEELVAGAFMKTVLDHPVVVEGDITQLR